MDPHPGPGEATGRRSPPVEAVDLDPANRPGVPRERDPRPWPNSRPQPARMRGEPATPRHGRPGKPMTPVFSTANPPRGLSGLIRRAAYRLPDHYTNHWLLLLLADRVQSWTRRARNAALVVVPAAAIVLALRRWAAART